MRRINSAFTLIELLIVVAIIAILAAIAVPNFIEAQTRAKVSRTKADMRTLSTGLESYMVDHNSYPLCHRFGIATRENSSEPLVLERLSTPVSYLSAATAIRDPFKIQGRLSASTAEGLVLDEPSITQPGQDIVADLNTYIYQAFQPEGRAQTTTDSFQPTIINASAWVLHSAGPDGFYHNLGGVLDLELNMTGLVHSGSDTTSTSQNQYGTLDLMYDPTNGTTSFGSIYRGEGSTGIGPDYAGGVGLLQAIRASQ